MKNFKIKLGLFSLLAILAVSVFLTSCEQTIIDGVQTETDAVSNSLLTEDELLAKLNSDEDALAFVSAVEELESIVRNTLQQTNTSIDMFRSHSQNETELEALFGETQLLAVHSKMEYHAIRFVEKFPNLEENLSKFITHQPSSNYDEHLPFSTLETDITLRGCGCCGANFWAKIACKALCAANGVGCAVLTAVTGWGPYACAVLGLTCSEFCDWYYCEYL